MNKHTVKHQFNGKNNTKIIHTAHTSKTTHVKTTQPIIKNKKEYFAYNLDFDYPFVDPYTDPINAFSFSKLLAYIEAKRYIKKQQKENIDKENIINNDKEM